MVVELLEGLGVGFLLENRGKFSSTKVSSSIFFFSLLPGTEKGCLD